MSMLKLFGLGLLGIFALCIFSKPSTSSTPITTKDPNEDVALRAGAYMLMTAREPDSVIFQHVNISSTGIVCLTAKGRNGFGGISQQQVVINMSTYSTMKSCPAGSYHDYATFVEGNRTVVTMLAEHTSR